MRPLLILGVLLFLLGYVWERVDVVRVGYRVEQLKGQKVLLERERDELSVKLASLSAPDRVARLAKEKLGMMPAQPGQVVVVYRAEPKPQPEHPSVQEVRVAKREVR
ncbi:MAG TPA: cell division protein FtsL [Nitrospiraceae bacterium]|nr:cell division protein FtsL [Nitrospiraceae bacterium]